MRKYESLTQLHENTLAPRAHYIPYDSLEKALAGKKEASAQYRCLNGTWDFRYFARDIDCPEKIDTWETITVPGCWQSQGYEKPYYTNNEYPYPVDPPFVPDDNPLGVYRRSIVLTEEEAKQEQYLIFEGVCSWFEVYVNGAYVGFSSVSRCTSEFKLNLQEGENELIVKVYKWCSGSYLEDQDCFRYNGIFRDVYLLFRPEGHLFDIDLGYDDKKVYCDHNYMLFDAEGKLYTGKNPILWNAEKPYLYTLVIFEKGEYIPVKIGFRTQAISEKGELLINGVSVKLKGVNRHDTDPNNGYTQTEEQIRAELLKMKELNINCIRTSHYPPPPVFMELCDELGFYVIDEADIETHGFGKRVGKSGYDPDPIWPCKDPKWKKAFLDRAERLLQRDKTHTSVVMWSLGNEANYGDNFAAMSEYIRQNDTRMGFHRLIHYENAYNYDPQGADPDTVDLVSAMYDTIEQILDYIERTGDKRPMYWCEYCHAMGNGPGDVKDYWDTMWNHPQLIGGCIWEWADHVAPLGEGKSGYGGDFGEEIHDGNFCCDGMVFSDRSFKAGSYEIKAVYQGLDTAFENGILTVHNRYDFTDLSEYRINWEQVADDKVVASGTLDLATKPHCKEAVSLQLAPVAGLFGTYLNITMFDGTGREVAHTQHTLSDETLVPAGEGEATITTEGEYATITGKDFAYRFNLHYGCMELDGYPMELTLWRAPTDNDRKIKVEWYKERYDKIHNKVYDVTVEGNQITVRASLAPVARLKVFTYTAKYTFFADGQVDVELEGDFDTTRTFLPRLGFEFATKESAFRYFGYGPIESYVDMHHGSKMGMFESTAEKEYVNYIMPQEHGNHYNTKLLELGGFAFVSRQGFECNVSKYTAKELETKQHNFELEGDGLTHVRVDYKVSGIGSGSCGPQLLEKYRLQDEKVKFAFSIVKL
ncbi:MAG: DUF4981 domain-containing protein [Oscillospiraceae bacterium]|nr:DUF4981 domain-containing protein [Oscillospiraceae bacterium]